MKVHEMLARAFAQEGVEHAFSLMGDGNMLWQSSLAALGRTKIFDVRDEGGGLAMADGYSRASDRVGVCSCTCGPGLTQTATAMMAAFRHGSPLVMLAGDVPASGKRAGGLQDIDQQRFIEASGGYFQAVRSPSTAAIDVQRAFHVARTERRPVVLNAPMDVQEEEFRGDEHYVPSTALMAPQAVLVCDRAQLSKAAERIMEAERPIILVGAGGAAARGECEGLGALIGALFATTVYAKGWFDGTGYSLDIAGGFSSRETERFFSEADLVIVVGASLSEQTTAGNKLFPKADIVQFDSAPARLVAGRRPVDCFVQGDARHSLAALNRLILDSGHKGGGFRNATDLARLNRDPRDAEIEDVPIPVEEGAIDPRILMRAIDKVLPDDAVIALGAGHFWSFPARFLSGGNSRRFLYSYDFGSISHGMPVAIGASIALGNKPVFVVEGDASLIMNIQELDTIARHRIPLTILVHNDSALGAEYHKLKARGLGIAGSDVASPDLAAVAKAFGLESATLTTVADLDTLGPLPRPAPFVIDARISREVANRSYRRTHYRLPE
jgi:thiamine pyrophosphate-dependent acetolactate synthase large subunit-like protein